MGVPRARTSRTAIGDARRLSHGSTARGRPSSGPGPTGKLGAPVLSNAAGERDADDRTSRICEVVIPLKPTQRLHGQVQIGRYAGGGLLEDFARGDVPRQVLEGGSFSQQVVGHPHEHAVPEAGPASGGTDLRNTGWRCATVT